MNTTAQAQSTGSQNINVITRKLLQAGDIIATRAHSVNSKGVRFFTHADVSH